MNCHEVNNHITNYPTIYHHQGQAMPSHLLFLAFTFRTGIHLKLINILCEVRVRIIFSPFDWSTSFIDKSLSLLTYHGAFAINQEPYMWGQYFLSPILFFLIFLLFIWLHQFLVAAWDILVPWPGINHQTPALGGLHEVLATRPAGKSRTVSWFSFLFCQSICLFLHQHQTVLIVVAS